jgi:hypothetical protein
MSLSNVLRYGFHPTSEIRVGDPHVPRTYDHPLAGNILSDNLVDDKPYASYGRADLSLEYIYEVETKYLLGGELITLPIVYRVYRRDPQLRWSEIRGAVVQGLIPRRYRHTDPVQAPMNLATFQKFIRRFYFANNDSGQQVIHEKGTRLPVEQQHEDFEWVLELMLPNKYTDEELFLFSAQDLANEVLSHTDKWHLDRLLRAQVHWRALHA